jgi:hypothetical protein
LNFESGCSETTWTYVASKIVVVFGVFSGCLTMYKVYQLCKGKFCNIRPANEYVPIDGVETENVHPGRSGSVH